VIIKRISYCFTRGFVVVHEAARRTRDKKRKERKENQHEHARTRAPTRKSFRSERGSEGILATPYNTVALAAVATIYVVQVVVAMKVQSRVARRYTHTVHLHRDA
jgi:hypothetical protein